MKALSLRWISFSVFIALLVTVLAPTSLGGSADYVIVDGRSMEPTYRDGDLVITRVAEEYQPGDVIAYDAPLDVPFP
ncbi:MAG: S24/S26 family peptidase, partial [Nitriliruptoraceae bacterium]